MPSVTYPKDVCFAVSTGAGAIDRDKAIIHAVSMLTEGEARGHGIQIDHATLEQVATAAKRYRGGVKVRIEHSGGVGEIVGALRSFSVVGDKLIANLHLLKTHPDTPRILEMAEEIPDTFGLSIVFRGVPEERDGKQYARCEEIYACDLVSQPAANPSGLFEQPKVDTSTEGKSMTELKITETAKAQAAAVTPPAAPAPEPTSLELTLNRIAQLEAKIAKMEADAATAAEKVAKEMESRASARALEIAAAAGCPPVETKPAQPAQAASPVKSYEDLWTAWHKLPVEGRQSFYAQHRDAMNFVRNPNK